MESLRLLLGDALEAFLDGWPDAQQHIVAHGLQARLPALFQRPELASFDAFLAAVRGPFTAQARNAVGELVLEPVADVDAARAHLRFGIPVQYQPVRLRLPDVREIEDGILRDLGLESEGRIVNIAFFSPPGRGLARHFDDKDVFVIGLLGTKVFYLAPNDSVRFPDFVNTEGTVGKSATATSAPDMSTDAVRVEVGPGDCLFIPRGMWHETSSAATPSVSISLGIVRPTMLDVVLRAVRNVLATNPELREPYPGSRRPIEPIADRVLVELRKTAQGMIAADVARHVEHQRARVVYARRRGFMLSVENGVASVLAPTGEEKAEIEVPSDLEPVLRHLANRTSPMDLVELVRSFPSVAPDLLLVMLESLHEAGFLERAR